MMAIRFRRYSLSILFWSVRKGWSSPLAKKCKNLFIPVLSSSCSNCIALVILELGLLHFLTFSHFSGNLIPDLKFQLKIAKTSQYFQLSERLNLFSNFNPPQGSGQDQ